jgi:hypothetical protein
MDGVGQILAHKAATGGDEVCYDPAEAVEEKKGRIR